MNLHDSKSLMQGSILSLLVVFYAVRLTRQVIKHGFSIQHPALSALSEWNSHHLLSRPIQSHIRSLQFGHFVAVFHSQPRTQSKCERMSVVRVLTRDGPKALRQRCRGSVSFPLISTLSLLFCNLSGTSRRRQGLHECLHVVFLGAPDP
jgi:hypothetical protein